MKHRTAWKVPSKEPSDLRSFIESSISSQNMLQLPPPEIASMTDLLMEARSKKEIYDWSATLMLGDVFASEIIRRREDLAEVESQSSTGANVPVPGRKPKGRRGNQRGKALSASTELVLGALFECGCFATTHPFKGSCANCGRVICQQESDEKCYFCGLDPARCIAHEIRVETGKIDAAAERSNKQDFEEALRRRNQLLQFARERTKRTAVIDDQSGQYCASAWTTKEEKEAALEEERRRVERMHRNTGAYVVHVDITNQAISLGAANPPSESPPHADASAEPESQDSEESEGADPRIEVMPNLLQKIWYGGSKKSEVAGAGKRAQLSEVFSARVQNEYFEGDETSWNIAMEECALSGEEKPVFSFAPALLPEDEPNAEAALQMKAASAPIVEMFQPSAEAQPGPKYSSVPRALRNRDDRRCLSLHQPWASLVVAGIKRHEGRTWPTDYRGKLWIHAAAAAPSRIEEVEQHYRSFVPEGTKFPTNYPTRCLLGFVYMLDCLEAKAYKETIPPEEQSESSEYAFILAEPMRLQFPLAMEGGPKIFQMEKKVWLAAQRQVETSRN